MSEAPRQDGLTAEQARAAFTPGSVAVVAGAGTGKTKMLAHRYLHHLDEGLSPLQVVAVTFTEKAAAELRSRIRALVRSERPENRRALAELEAAPISTIHALASRVCREHPERAGVPADFRVLDDLERTVWKSARLEEAIAQLHPDVHSQLPVALLRTALAQLLDDPVVAEEALACGPDVWRELLEREVAAAYTDVVGTTEWSSYRQVLTGLSGFATDPADLGELARRACLAAMSAFEARDAAEALELVKTFRTNAGKKGAWELGGLEELREALKAVKGIITQACGEGVVTLKWGRADDWLAEVTPAIIVAFDDVRRRMEAYKLAERVLDFADLERNALKALEHTDVRQHYAERWRALLVDEFQDTNPVQARLLRHLESAAITTVVGDEKQAIYGFRGADVEVFRRYRETISQRGGDLVTLSKSFRSHTGLVEAFDGVFSPLLGDLHQSVSAIRQPGSAGPHLSLHALNAEGRVLSSRRRLAEAYEIGTLIRELVESEYPVFDVELSGHRPVRFGDVAILTRGYAPFDTYSQVLPALGVPTVDTGGGNLLGAREAKDGLAALRVFADPSDDVALAAVLRSPFFAVDDAALRRFVQTLAERERWWTGLERVATAQSEGEDPHLKRAAEVLVSILSHRWQQPASRLLQDLDEATGYSAVVANLPGGRRRLADWRGFAALVRAIESVHGDAFAVNRQLRQLLLAEIEVARPPLQAGDAVALMTIHRSKGLEWPVVIVADLSYEGNRSGPGAVIFEAGCGVSLKLPGVWDDDEEEVEPVLHKLLLARRKRREAEELKRLLYVALTRGRDRVMLTTSAAEAGPMKVLGPALTEAGIPATHFELDPDQTYPDPPLPEPGELGLRLEPELAAFDATLGATLSD
ncbi:MAG: UvrD-helicase domain-containing protein [Trueperaceae bacterium]|nr:UvrD-helicase domain-containing protein [Trueperaceae bacterium]